MLITRGMITWNTSSGKNELQNFAIMTEYKSSLEKFHSYKNELEIVGYIKTLFTFATAFHSDVQFK
jgi:hypothetical protein